MNQRTTGYPVPRDVPLVFGAQGSQIQLRLHGREYTGFEVPFSREDVEHGLENATPERGVDPLRSFGARLFNTLLSDERRKTWWEQLARVTTENGAVRLRILTELERLNHLPWELLFDSTRRDFIALSGRVALVRTRPGHDQHADLAPLQKLRILAVTADPDGSLQADDELESFCSLVSGGADTIALETLKQATTEQLLQKLAAAQFDIFIFFGAGQREERLSKAGGLRQAIKLVPGGDEDDGLLNRNALGAALRKAKVRLAVMNGSHTDWVARSLAKHVPAALGFREQVCPQTRRVSMDALGRVLLRRVPLDLGITGVRQAIDQSQPGSGEWCRLIFYLQPAHGNFLLAQGEQPTATESVAADVEQSRELAKLERLRQIVTTNLDAPLSIASPVDLVTSLRTRLANLDDQITVARGAPSQEVPPAMKAGDILRWLADSTRKLRELQDLVHTCEQQARELDNWPSVLVKGELELVKEMKQQLAKAYEALAALPDDVEARRQEIDVLLDDVGWELLEELRPQFEDQVKDHRDQVGAACTELNQAKVRLDALAAEVMGIGEAASIQALVNDLKAAESGIGVLETSLTDRLYERLADKCAAAQAMLDRLQSRMDDSRERIDKIRSLVKQADLLIMQTSLASGDFEYRILLRCADRSQTRGINIIQDVKKLTKLDHDWMLGQGKALTQGINLRLSQDHAARKAPASRTLAPADPSGRVGAEPGDPATIMQTLGTFMKRMVIPDQMCELLMSQDWSFSITTNDLALPWELMFFESSDGKGIPDGAFFCLSKSLSRMPLGKMFPRPERRYPSDPKKKRRMLLIHSDPRGDLPAAATEIDTIAQDLGDRLDILCLTSDEVDNVCLNEILMGFLFDFIHYAGHARFDSKSPGESGLLLRHGVVLSADKIGALNRGGVLVFLNACESGMVASDAEAQEPVSYLPDKPEPVAGLASAFVYSGAMGCVGSLWPVYDAAAAAFAVAFYHRVLDGDPIGEALRQARVTTRELHEGATWASYVLYGDPTYRLPHSD